MVNYSEEAAKNFREGYNCSQSVLLAFSERVGLDKDTCLKLASSFGGGMGRLREVCGAVSAMFMVAGILKGYTSPNDDIAKAGHYKLIQELAGRFRDKFGSIVCRDLLGLETERDSYVPSVRTAEYYEKRPCEKCISYAAEIIASELLD